MLPIPFVRMIGLMAFIGDPVIFPSAALRLISPIRGNVVFLFQPLETGVHRGFFKFIFAAGIDVHEL